VGKSLDGCVISWNGAAERIFGWSADEMIGRSVRVLIPADRQQEEDRIIASVRAGKRVPSFDTVRLHKDGHLVQVAVTVSPVRDASGQIVAASKIARDIGEARRVQAQLEDSEQRFRLLADNISQLAWIADPSGWLFWYNRRWFEYTGTDIDHMRRWGWSKVHHPDHLDRVNARWQDHLARDEGWEDTYPIRGADGTYRWFLSRAVPAHDAAGNVAYWFGTNTDVTEMRDAEERIELLMLEVNHRSKNMLAIIQALARRTVSQSGKDFVPRLESRIQALAANQDLLVNRSWASVPVNEMIQAQLPFLGEAAQQVEYAGPEVMLSPGAAESIAMAVHEMATNAVKYGALGSPAGRVSISWSLDTRADSERFTISWRERGGPPASEPESRGFGTRIIADVPRTKLQAEVSMSFATEGFSWTLDCAAKNVMPRLDPLPRPSFAPGWPR
jgi:PAS domain S-box-containing protein